MNLRRVLESSCANGRLKIDNLTRTTNNLQQRASCAWNYAIDHDDRRDPAELIIARCVCPSSHSSHCQPVLYTVPVKRFNDSVQQWVDTWDLVTVGCTSVNVDVDYTDYTEH